MDKKREKIALWFRNRSRIFRIFMVSIKVPDRDIDGLAKEVFLRLSGYTDETLLNKSQIYVFRVAIDVAKTWKRMARNRHVAGSLENLENPMDREDQSSAKRMEEKVKEEVLRLPPEQREVLLLHVNEGLAYWQIAEMHCCSHEMVLEDLCRAYATLRITLLDDRVSH